jgi:hypothetical protein
MEPTAESRKRAMLFQEFAEQLTAESDRGSVIVSASVIDDVLAKLIQAMLVPSVEKRDELFEGATAPFSTFSARIDLAYRLGLIKVETRASFHLLRKIRNDFAHVIDAKNFESESVQSRLTEIRKLNRNIFESMNEAFDNKLPGDRSSKGVSGRLAFEMFIAASAAFLLVEIDNIEPLEPLR